MKQNIKATLIVLSGVASWPQPSIAQGDDSCGVASVVLIGDRSLTVNPDTSAASREIVLRNGCEKKPVEGVVVVTDFVSDTTKSPLHAESAISELQADGSWKRVRRVSVPAKQDLLLRLDVTNLWDTGRSKATLSFDGRDLADVFAYNYRLPFPISLATPTPLTLTKSESVSLILANGGTHTYPIRWTFGTTAEERASNKESLVLSPNADTEIRFEPPDSWFDGSFERFFRPAERTAFLTLSMHDPADETRPELPRKTISVPVKLESYSPTKKAIVSNVTAFVLLILGALCSLLVNNWVPNRLRRVALQQRISSIANATRGISDRIASLLRVLLRVQRNQASERLDRVWTWSPNFESVAAEVTRSLDELSVRVDLTCQMDQLISRLYANRDVPVSVVDRYLEDFAPTVEVLAKPDVPVATLDEIRRQIAAVAMRLATARDAQPAFAQELFKRWQSLTTRLNGKVKTSPLFLPNEAPLKDLKDTVGALQFAKADDIDPANYCKLDITFARLEALLDAFENHAARSVEQQEHMTGNHAKKGTRSFMAILKEDYVANSTPESVRSAKLLVEQMKAGVYADDVVKALGDPDAPRPQIVLDPPLPITDEAITFSLQFPQATWTNSAALRKLRCEWNFGDKLSERGWIVSHYFPKADEHTVTVTIYDLEGAPIDVGQAQGRIERTFSAKKAKSGPWVSGRTRTEIVYMFIALGAAIAALASGAKQSLLQLDFAMGLVAVFLVGFGADSIKNVLTSSKGRTT